MTVCTTAQENKCKKYSIENRYPAAVTSLCCNGLRGIIFKGKDKVSAKS